LAYLVGGESGHDGQALLALLAAAGSRRLGDGGRARRARAAWTWRFFLFGFADLRTSQRADREFRLGLLLAEPLLRLLLRVAFGLLIVLAAVVLLALARFGCFALRTLDRLAHFADARLFLGDLALLGVAQASVGQRVGARLLLFRGQGL